MLLLFETAAGFALFKVNKEDKLEQTNVCADATACGRTSSRAAIVVSAADLLSCMLLQDYAKDFESVEGAKKVWDECFNVIALSLCMLAARLAEQQWDMLGC
jgi:hypothetical protein